MQKSALCGIKKVTPVRYLEVASSSIKKAHTKYTRSVWKAVIRADLTAGHCCLLACPQHFGALIACLGGDRNGFWEPMAQTERSAHSLDKAGQTKRIPTTAGWEREIFLLPKITRGALSVFLSLTCCWGEHSLCPAGAAGAVCLSAFLCRRTGSFHINDSFALEKQTGRSSAV